MDGRGGGRIRARPHFRALVFVVGMILAGAVSACGNGDGDERPLAVAPGASPTEAAPVETSSASGDGEPGPASSSVLPASREEPRRQTDATERAVAATTSPPGAQTTTSAPAAKLATIHGMVSRGGEPAPGARLTLVAGDGAERVTTADGSGAYRFTDVPAGHYELITYAESGKTCDASGCISASWSQRDEVTVAAGETVRFDVKGG